jgi:hypothetical protein
LVGQEPGVFQCVPEMLATNKKISDTWLVNEEPQVESFQEELDFKVKR